MFSKKKKKLKPKITKKNKQGGTKNNLVLRKRASSKKLFSNKNVPNLVNQNIELELAKENIRNGFYCLSDFKTINPNSNFYSNSNSGIFEYTINTIEERLSEPIKKLKKIKNLFYNKNNSINLCELL